MFNNDAEIAALELRQARYGVTDEKGLSIDVLPSGIKSWLYRYRFNGRPEKVVIGRFPDISLSRARERRRDLYEQVTLGRSPLSAQRGRVLFEQFARQWVENNDSDIRRKELTRQLDSDILPVLGTKKLAAITQAHILRVLAFKVESGYGTTGRILLGTMKRIFASACRKGLLTINPANNIRPSEIECADPHQRVLTMPEIGKYLEAVEGSGIDIRWKSALRLLTITLAKRKELLHARWEHVDLKRGEWTIPTRKTFKIIYLSKSAITVFRQLSTHYAFVFPAVDGRRSVDCGSLNAALSRVHHSVGRVLLHDLRRTAATTLTERGFELDLTELALGHERTGSELTNNFSMRSGELRDLFNHWSSLVDEIAPLTPLLLEEL